MIVYLANFNTAHRSAYLLLICYMVYDLIHVLRSRDFCLKTMVTLWAAKETRTV